MSDRAAPPAPFPTDAYLGLLTAAQELFRTKDAREALLDGLGVSMERQGAARPQDAPAVLGFAPDATEPPPAPPPGGPTVKLTELLSDRDAALAQQSAARSQDAPQAPADEPTPKRFRPGTRSRAVDVAGTTPDDVSAADLARLVEELSTPGLVSQSIILARRIADKLPNLTPQADALIDRLQALLLSLGIEAGAAPDLAGYRSWRGFVCAHEYSLTDRFFGRADELRQLDAWIDGGAVSVHCICALGGGGKSALAWRWLNDALPLLRQKGYAGAFWCSFYEKNFGFETFLERLLMFAGQLAEEQLRKLTRQQIEDRLLETLEQSAFVVVMDGVERLMNGYAVSFERAVDPDSEQRGKHERELTSSDRRMADLRDGLFLRRLARAMPSKVLITSRLRPADLEQPDGVTPLPHAAFSVLGGLEPAALEQLWSSIVPTCPINEVLEAIFETSGRHPLIVSILARSVAMFEGDWQRWTEHPTHWDYLPRQHASEAEVRAHLIGVCIRDLDERAHDVLGVLTTSGKPMALRLVADILLRGSDENGDDRWRAEEQVADQLADLVRRGLVGVAERVRPPEYDVHPVVRGVIWNVITASGGRQVLTHALSEFLATPGRGAPDEGLDLNKAISYLRLLAQRGEVDRAWELYYTRLYAPLTRRSENRELIDLFELLLPDGNVLQLLPLASRAEQGNATYTLGGLLMEAGDGRGDELLRWTGAIRLQAADFPGFLSAGRARLWHTMYEGRLFETECALYALRRDAQHFRAPAIIPYIDIWIGMVKAIRGRSDEARRFFAAAEELAEHDERLWAQGAAEGWVYCNQPDKALELLDGLRPWQEADGRQQQAWELLTQGMALFQKQAYAAAWNALAESLQIARRANVTIIQCLALPSIAEIQLERGNAAEAEQYLADYTLLDEGDQYRLSAADAWRVRARCRLAAGDREAALAAAARAYTLAACDGPPFTYASALARARATLAECEGYVPITRSQVDPSWRSMVAALEADEQALATQAEAGAGQPALMTTAKAWQVLRQEAPAPLLQAASEADRQWWHAVMRGAPDAVSAAVIGEMEALDIALARFREVFETGGHESLEVTFHQLSAERLLGPDTPRPLHTLDETARRQWLSAVDEHQRAVETFLQTEFAHEVRRHFEHHQFGQAGIDAFLHDNKRRLAYHDDVTAKRWWDQLEGVCLKKDVLVLSQCLVLVGATLGHFVQEIATGTAHGITYAFAALHVQRSIQRLNVTQVSRTEGWSELQLQLRLVDIKRRIKLPAASTEAQAFWQRLEANHPTRKILELAEELALRQATLDDFYRAFVFSGSDNLQANLAYVDYTLLKQTAWDPGGPWPTVALLHGQTSRPTDTSTWSEDQVARRLQALLDRVQLASARADAQVWWQALGLPAAARLRVAEELELRGASVDELFAATVDGATRNIPAAIAYLEVSRTTRHETRSPRQRARERNQEGNRQYEQRKYAAAIDSYEAAIREWPGDPFFYTNLSGAWLARADLDYGERLAAAEHALRRGLEQFPGHQRTENELNSIVHRARLYTQGGLSSEAQSTPMLPVVTPIAVEVAGDLVSYYDGDNAPGNVAIARMRARIGELSGFSVPRVRIRGNEADMPTGSYLIMLDEVPIVMGTVDASQVLTNLPGTELRARGISFTDATDPLDGSDAAWIAAEDAAGLGERTCDLSEYIARHLEGVLRRSMAMFVGSTEVREKVLGSRSDQARALLEDPDGLLLLTRVLQALVGEQVPTADFEALCEAFCALRSGQPTFDGIVAELRRLPAVRAKLPGTAAPTRLLRLGPDLEEALYAGLQEYGDAHVLALEPEFTQEALSAVRASYNSRQPAAIVCEDPILRPYIRRLVELEFPHLHVLAAAELAPERRDAIEQVIEIE